MRAAPALLAVVSLAVSLSSSRAGAEIPPYTPLPSFSSTATVSAATGPMPGTPVMGPGCPYTGSWAEIILPDGTRLDHISQVNIIAPGVSPTPCPGYPLPPLPTPNTTITRVEDDFFTYFGTWTAFPSSPQFPKSGVGDHVSAEIGAAYGILFTGTGARIYGAKAPWYGSAAFSFDGAAPTEVDCYAAIRVDQTLIWSSPPLTPGVHRVVVTLTGTRNPASTGITISADRIDIIGGDFIAPLAP